MKNPFTLSAALFLSLTLQVPAMAGDYPDRSIVFVSPYSAGGSADQVARPIAEMLATKLGQSIVVENKTGASGVIGTADVAKSPADGYKFVIGAAGPIAILPRLRELPYDSENDLVPVAWLGDFVTGLAVSNSMKVGTVAELVDYAKKHPGAVHYSSAGHGTTSNLRGELFAHQAGAMLTHVPYRSNADAIPDLVSGNVQMMFESIVFPLAKEKKVTLLAILDDERFPAFPETPTMAEAGFPDFKIPLWYVLYAPGGTPKSIIEKLNKEIVGIVSDPKFSRSMLDKGIRVRAYALPELTKKMDEQKDMYRNVISKLNIKLQ